MVAAALIPGRFFLNLDGRERRGSVPAEGYEEGLAELKADINSLEGPDGTPVVERVVEGREYFHGDHTGLAPDLVAIPTDGFDLKAGFSDDHNIFETGPRNGMHSFDNASLFIDDPAATIPDDADLYDIAPTILELMEIDYTPSEFEGRSLV